MVRALAATVVVGVRVVGVRFEKINKDAKLLYNYIRLVDDPRARSVPYGKPCVR